MKTLLFNFATFCFGLLFLSICAEAQVNTNPTWRVGARCFNDGPSGSFDDIAVKDPTIVYSGGRYHMFYTGKDNSSWRMGYASATSLDGLNNSSHTYMSSFASSTGNYFCAPHVFYHSAKGQWYLVFQSGMGGATYSTNSDVGNSGGWSAPRTMGFSGGIDFFCIREGNTMYVFYAPNDDSRTILRRSTSVTNFPTGWSGTSVVATSTFEAVAVYRNNADGMFYMITEDLYRHYELWRASSPGGTFTKLSEEWAAANDIIYTADHWTDQVSHGEIIRAGTNEYMEINDINNCTLLFQGVANGSYGDYGNIPYDIGYATNGGGGGCTPTAITPYIQVNGGTWQQTSSVTVASGATVKFGPQPASGGSWSWSGCGTSGTSREQTVYPTSTCTATATYTNTCGAQSNQNFNVTVSSSSSSSSGGIVSGGIYRVTPRNGGKALDVSGCATTDGANVQNWSWLNNNCQKWQFTSLTGGYWRISPMNATSKALDVSGVSTADGANVHIWAYGGGNNQQWQLVSVTGGYYQIVARHSGKCLDLAGGVTTDGANIQQWNCSGSGTNGHFTLTRLSSAEDVLTESLTGYMLYPSPVDDNLHITISGQERVNVRIYNNLGALAISSDFTGDTKILDVSKLTPGMYFIRLEGNERTITDRFIKK